MEAQRLNHLLVVDGAQEHHFVAGGCLDGLMIGIAVFILAQHGQLHAARLAREALDDFQQRVLGFGPGDDAEVAAGLQAQGRHRGGVGRADVLGAIGNDSDALGAGTPGQVDLDLGVIGHEVVAQPGARPFIQIEPGLGTCAPLGALPLDAIHVDDVGQACHAQQRAEDGGVVAEREARLTGLLGVTGGDPVELDGAGRAGPVDGDVDAVDAFPSVFGDGAGAVDLTVDGDLPALLHQIERQVFGKGLEPAMRCRHTTNAEDAQRRGGMGGHGRRCDRSVGHVAQNLTPSSR